MHSLAVRRGGPARRFGRLLGLGLSVGLGLGGLAATVGSPPAGATSVSSVSFTGASQSAGVATTWTVGFTVSASGTLSNTSTISVVFASGFGLPGTPTVSLGTGFSDCTATGTTATQTVTVTLHGASCKVEDDAAVQLSIGTITNPGPGSYPGADFSVATSADTSPQSPSGDVVIAAAVSGVTIGASSYVTHTVTNWTVDFTTSASGSLAQDDNILVQFPAGFGLPASPVIALIAGFSQCSATGTTSVDTVRITLYSSGGTCSVPDSTLVTVTIEGLTNPAPGTYPGSDFLVSTTPDSGPVPASDSVTITGTGSSSVTFAGSSQAADATDVTWTIGFTTSGSGALGVSDTISVTFAAGFGLPPTPTVQLVDGFTDCTTPTTGSTSADTVSFTLSGTGCSVPADTAVVLDILDITNPGAGSYPAADFGVATTSDPAFMSPANPVVIGIAPNGSGTLTVTPTSVGVSSTGDTLVFTYTAATGGLADGTIDVTVPSNWTVPTTAGTLGGYTTSTCGTVSIVGVSTIQVADVTLGTAGTCTITYGSVAAGGPGATAPATSQVSTFSALEGSVPEATPVALATSPQVTVGAATPLPEQIFGVDPIGTAIAVSQAEFPTPLSASSVVLARDDFFSDALAGGPLAAAVNGPMLLTESPSQSTSLDPRVLTEIERVLSAGGTVYILGGPLAISTNVDAELQGLGYNTVREAGSDEYDTAYLIAQALGSPDVIFEATGLNYYDALSAVPAAIEHHGAILLTDGSTQAFVTAVYIIAHPGATRYAIGGPLAAYGADPGAIAVYGQDQFGTSAAVAQTFFPGASIYGAATSATFTDALAGGVYMATGGRSGAILLVNPSAPLPSAIVPYLNSLAIGTQGYVFGGPLAVGPDVLSALQQAVG